MDGPLFRANFQAVRSWVENLKSLLLVFLQPLGHTCLIDKSTTRLTAKCTFAMYLLTRHFGRFKIKIAGLLNFGQINIPGHIFFQSLDGCNLS